MNKEEIDLSHVNCRGYGFENILGFVVFLFMLVLSIWIFGHVFDDLSIKDFIDTKIFLLIFVQIMITLYFGLIIKNKSFSIVDNKITYKNIFGKIYEYDMSDIDNVIIDYRLKGCVIVRIQMVDRKKIVLNNERITNIDVLIKRFKKDGLYMS